MIRFLSLLVLIPIVILFAAFAYNNAEPVSVDLFIYQINIPLAVLLLLTLIMGVALGYMLNLYALFRLKRKIYRLNNKKAALKDLSSILSKSDK